MRAVHVSRLSLAALVAASVFALPASAALAPIYGYKVVRAFPHDPQAFTEGLFYLNGRLFESTGLNGHSDIREVDLQTGRVLRERAVDPQYFGEGIVAWKGELIELTWRSQVGFVYDLATFQPRGAFGYAGEGWALTRDDHRLIMSDGTPYLRFLDPGTLAETGRIEVTDAGRPVANLNELEWVKGEIYANVWQTDRIARIDPKTGVVLGWIDLAGLLPRGLFTAGRTDVLNGIAYDAVNDRLFVTGKMWPRLYQITLTPPPGRR